MTPETYQSEDIEEAYTEADRLYVSSAAINGYETTNGKGETVVVNFIDSRKQWYVDNRQPKDLAIGSHTQNNTVSAQGPGDTGDVHPSGQGMAKIAEILKPYWLKDIRGF